MLDYVKTCYEMSDFDNIFLYLNYIIMFLASVSTSHDWIFVKCLVYMFLRLVGAVLRVHSYLF